MNSLFIFQRLTLSLFKYLVFMHLHIADADFSFKTILKHLNDPFILCDRIMEKTKHKTEDIHLCFLSCRDVGVHQIRRWSCTRSWGDKMFFGSTIMAIGEGTVILLSVFLFQLNIIRRVLRIVDPIHELTTLAAETLCYGNAKTIFCILKSSMSESHTSNLAKADKIFSVYTDALNYGLRAVLMERNSK